MEKEKIKTREEELRKIATHLVFGDSFCSFSAQAEIDCSIETEPMVLQNRSRLVLGKCFSPLFLDILGSAFRWLDRPWKIGNRRVSSYSEAQRYPGGLLGGIRTTWNWNVTSIYPVGVSRISRNGTCFSNARVITIVDFVVDINTTIRS